MDLALALLLNALLWGGLACGVIASAMQFRMLAQLNATRPAEQQIRWYATGDYGTGWSVWKEHQRVFPQSKLRRWMLTLWLSFAFCIIACGVFFYFFPPFAALQFTNVR